MRQIGLICEGKEYNFDKIDRKVVRGIGLHDGKLIMLYSEKYGNYSFPGGGMKKDESAIDCLRREVNEETGYIIKNISKRPIGYIDEAKMNGSKLFTQRTSYYFYEIDHIERAHKEKHEKIYETVLVHLEDALEKNKEIDSNVCFVQREIIVLNLLKEEYYERVQSSKGI
ncbi:MAG: NUDIX domain-containing protein [bacterium]|nr:NUDIX domain-containing protein [bacterium]